MARIRDIVLVLPRPSATRQVLGYRPRRHQVAAYNEAEIARLRALGIDELEDDPSVLVKPSAGNGPRICFTRVAEGT